MEAATASVSLAFCSPSSSRLQDRSPPTSVTAGTSGLWCRRRTRLPLLRAVCTLDLSSDVELVNVIGIGSRKYSVLDFCLASPSVSSSRFKFWTIYSRDQMKIQLLERCHGKDEVIRNVEFPISPNLCHPTVILLASSGHGLDYIAAVDLLNNIKSVGGLAIAIVMKPFSFEGQIRKKEVNDLVNNLKSFLKFYIVVEVDSFIKVDVETLAEVLESAHSTVLLALNSISSMISKMHSKILSTPEGKVRDIKPSEVVKALESYGEVKIYHGAGYSVNAAIMQAILHSPFFDGSLKDFSGLAIMTLTCAWNIGDNVMSQVFPIFRRITGYTGDIIFSNFYEPNLEEKFVVATLLIMGRHNEKMVSQNRGFLSSLFQKLPSFLRLVKVDSTEDVSMSTNSSHGDTFLPSDSGDISILDITMATYPLELIPDEDEFPNMLENVLSRKASYDETTGVGAQSGPNNVSNNTYSGQKTGEELPNAMMIQSSHHIDPAFHIAQLWAKKCFESRTKINDKVDICSLPIGVKPSKLSKDRSSYYNHMLAENSDYINQEISGGITADLSKKNSLLSIRAAMMLEAERESTKCWNPIVEIQYRGGIYKGRCQGGLPEGKGRLTFIDGSFYEGFWKFGKRSGFGTFGYSNGDLFQGPWRDDLMHGKGWLYFHTGDRWFANFWRGKANGEGKFFSKNGSVFYGAFRDGWRHGPSVYIDGDGSRWREVWDDGVLVDRTPHDKGVDI